jgi:acyl-CoA thioester hydrolase
VLKPAAPGALSAVFTWLLRVYWEDTDAGGIVFYANYLKFMERARTEWLRSLGVQQSVLQQTTGGMFVVTDTTVKYLQPARLDDELLVTACLTAKGRASLTIAQQISKLPNKDGRKQLSNNEHSNATVLCHGTIRIGWVDSATLGPARIPDTLLEIFI